MEQLLTYLAGFISVAIIGFVKKITGPIDEKIAAFIKPFQPILAAALSVALPFLANLLHLTAIPDGTIFMNAPLATIIGIVCAEIYARLNPPVPPVPVAAKKVK